MAVRFKDYYETLGVSRGASAEEIRRAYRQLARKHHPDANKGEKSSEERFKEINEAYEVLKDPEKRQRYDTLGANWKSGQDFNPPPGWEGYGGPGGGGGGGPRAGFNFGGFSDFFEALFGQGGAAGQGGRGPRVQFRGAGGGPGGFPFDDGGGYGGFEQAPSAAEVEIQVPLEVVLAGGPQTISLSIPGRGTQTFTVRIPKGIAEGKKIRLAGEGPNGTDIHLKVAYAAGGPFRMDGDRLVVRAPISPAKAVLGGKVEVPTASGTIAVTVPAGSSSGRRLRIRGRGLATGDGAAGDLLVEIAITVPENPTAAERKLYEELGRLEDEG